MFLLRCFQAWFILLYVRGLSRVGVCVRHCWIKCTNNSTLLALILRMNIGLARRRYKNTKMCVIYGWMPLFWQIALLSDADHWTINLSISSVPCALSLSFTPLHSFFRLILPLYQLSHFSFDLALISLNHLVAEISVRHFYSISQSLGAKWGIIRNITLQCTSLMKRGECVADGKAIFFCLLPSFLAYFAAWICSLPASARHR